MTTTYAPAAGTAAARLIQRLKQEPQREFSAAELAEVVGCSPKSVASHLEPALDHGLVFRRQRDRTSIRAPFWYSATDHASTQRHAGFAALQAWMAPPKINRKDAEESGSSPGTPGASGTPEVSCASSAEAAAADAPSGDQGAAAGADRAAAPTPNTSAPGSQQVLKAEAARPDATDRETPDTASPGVGPMGAGPPADAGPTTDMLGRPMRFDSSGAYGVIAIDARAPDESAAQQGPPVEQPREVDAQFAASLRAAMNVDVDDCLARGAELGRRKSEQLHPADLAATRRAVGYVEHGGKRYCEDCGQREGTPHLDGCGGSFRAARFSDGSLHFERHGQVIASLSAAEVDVLVRLLGART